MNPPAGWVSDEVMTAKVITDHPEASPAKLGVLIIGALRDNHRLLLPPSPPNGTSGES